MRAFPVGGLELLLVRASDGERWTFPKGRCERGESPARAAVREASEQAGSRAASGRSWAPTATPRRAACAATSSRPFPLDVGQTGLPAEAGRDPAWYGREKARSRLAAGRDAGYGEHIAPLLSAGLRAAPAVQ